MNNILIWADKPRSVDPTTHFWLEKDGVPYRVCDGREWIEGPGLDNRPDFPVPCRTCKETYLEDVLRGKGILTLLPEPPPLKIYSYTHRNMVYSTNIGVYPSSIAVHSPDSDRSEAVIVPRIPLSSFARFYEANPSKQVTVVRDIRTRLIDPEGYFARDYYGSLRGVLRKTHWATGKLDTFENALAPLLARTRMDKKLHYQILGESYIDFWRSRNASCFHVESVDVEIAGLTIVVTPEVGMRTGNDYQALKIWFNAKSPTRPARQVIHYLMDQANLIGNDWQDRWHSGLLDIRRKNIPLPVRTARDFELGITGQVAAFLQIWEELDRRAGRAAFGE